MAQNIGADAFDVVWSHIAASFKESVSASRQCQVDRRPGRAAISNQSFHLQAIFPWVTSRSDQVDDVIFHPIIDEDLIHYVSRLDDLLRLHDGLYGGAWLGGSHQIQN